MPRRTSSFTLSSAATRLGSSASTWSSLSRGITTTPLAGSLKAMSPGRTGTPLTSTGTWVAQGRALPPDPTVEVPWAQICRLRCVCIHTKWQKDSYRQVGASQLVQVAHPPGHQDAPHAAHLHAQRHDAAADGVGLPGGLQQQGKAPGLDEVCPVDVLGDVLRGETSSNTIIVAVTLALGGKQDGKDGGNGDVCLLLLRAVRDEIGHVACAGDLELEEGVGDVACRVAFELGDDVV